MALRQISLNGFRNLKSSTLNFHHQLNLITGLNASGKTSLLEAIHILCKGRSFKTHQLTSCIQHNKSNFLLFALFKNFKTGFSRSKDKTIIRLDGETLNKVSSLAKKTPVRIINSSSFELITGSPTIRREYIDWCLFHVEHNYLSLSLEFKHVLKQRNALLKSRKNLSALDYWDECIIKLSNKIYKLRLKYIEDIKKIFDTEFQDVFEYLAIDILYTPGWDVTKSLTDIYKCQRSRDIKYGFTRYGVHRDDIKFFSHGTPIQSLFSRGQIKVVSILLILAQLHLLNNINDKKVVLLVDDIKSELDEISVAYVVDKFSKLNLQLFITSINSPLKLLKEKEEYKLFHVEHGMIKAVNNTREHNVRI